MESVNGTAKKDEVINYEVKEYNGIVFDHADKDNLVISNNEGENILNVYYRRKVEPHPPKATILVRYVDTFTGELIEDMTYSQWYYYKTGNPLPRYKGVKKKRKKR